MRLIDADELKLSHCKECTLYPNQCLKDDCDWNSIYHIDHAKTIEAIPISWLEKCNFTLKLQNTTLPINFIIANLIDIWRTENDTN